MGIIIQSRAVLEGWKGNSSARQATREKYLLFSE
jgi:hypothetical protein